MTIDFPGGVLSEYLSLLKSKLEGRPAPQRANIIVDNVEVAARLELPPISLSNVTFVPP